MSQLLSNDTGVSMFNVKLRLLFIVLILVELSIELLQLSILPLIVKLFIGIVG